MRPGVRVAALSAAVALAAVAGCASYSRLSRPGDNQRPATTLPASLVQPGPGLPVGVYEPGFPRTVSPLATFQAATGVRPRMAVYYSGWNEPFRASFADAARARGAVPVVQLDPAGVSLTAVSDGQSDRYLRAYATAVQSYPGPVIVSLGHEMNGTWYSWGSGHQAPQAFVAAWRHVVTMFRQAGAKNVTWLWAVSAVTEAGADRSAGQGRLAQWWPGDQWAGLVGIDGYYYTPADTFQSVFGLTLTQVRQFTTDPVIISEVGISPGPGRPSQIKALFPAARTAGIAALIWFDVPQHGGRYHQDWRLEDSPSALAAFKSAAHSYQRLPARCIQ